MHIRYIRAFWLRLVRDGDCWLWPGRRDRQGYGEHSRGYTHRTAYQLVYGPITNDQQVLHACDNPPCCNPLHLRRGTNRDNQREAMLKNRKRNAHSKPDRKPVTPELATMVRQLRVAGVLYRDIAAATGLHSQTCMAIVWSKRWRDIGAIPPELAALPTRDYDHKRQHRRPYRRVRPEL